MKIQVRTSVFETNSSSTHSLAIITKEQSEALDRGEVYIGGSSLEIMTPEEVQKEWEEYRKDSRNYYTDIENFRKKFLYVFTMEEFEENCEDNCYEILWQKTPDEKYEAISLWGDRC